MICCYVAFQSRLWGNENKIAIEVIGTFKLFLNTYYLDLVETCVAPFIRRKSISISILDKSSYSCSFGNNKVNLSCDSNDVDYGSLIDIECSYD